MHRYTIFYVNNLQDWTLQYPIFVIYIAVNDLWMRLKNILYHICFYNKDSLPGDDDDVDDTGDMSTCDMQPTDGEVAEIFRKQVTW